VKLVPLPIAQIDVADKFFLRPDAAVVL